MVALRHCDEYPMNEGEIVSTSGLSIPVERYEQEFVETHVAHSTALHSRRTTGATYLVGPLPRVNINLDRLSSAARRLVDEMPIEWPNHNPFHSIIARGLEVVHAYEEALDILRTYEAVKPARVPYQPRAGEGCAATEAPRGLLYHRYQVDDSGKVAFAKIVPPTSQNQSQIEEDLRTYLPRILSENDAVTGHECEKLIRSYDPCISCATHFLKVKIERQ
jgi:coenzyme F420-reducing hydrogenase alpha subunit